MEKVKEKLMTAPRRRQYYWDTPVVYDGKEYPANVETLSDNNGNLVSKNVFATADGNRYFVNDDNTLTDVYMDAGSLPEVAVTAPMGETGVRNKMADAYRLNVFSAKGPLGYLQFENDLRNKSQQRQAIMRAAGYNVPQNGFWSDEQQQIWNKLTTKSKDYDTTVKGLIGGLSDKITGNTTYNVDPTAPDQVSTDNRDNVNYSLTRRSQNKFIGSTVISVN